MSPVADAAGTLQAALGDIPGIRVYMKPGSLVDPPAVVIGPPRLIWNGPAVEPTDAEFLVQVVVAGDDLALERLWDLVPAVAAALDTVTTVAVKRADPGIYPAGSTNLPAYEIFVEMSL